MKLLINPKAPKYVVEHPELYQNSGWDMDDSKCRFSVKHKVGDYHSLHHGWVDNAENPKLLNDLKKIRGKEVFIFR